MENCFSIRCLKFSFARFTVWLCMPVLAWFIFRTLSQRGWDSPSTESTDSTSTVPMQKAPTFTKISLFRIDSVDVDSHSALIPSTWSLTWRWLSWRGMRLRVNWITYCSFEGFNKVSKKNHLFCNVTFHRLTLCMSVQCEWWDRGAPHVYWARLCVCGKSAELNEEYSKIAHSDLTPIWKFSKFSHVFQF